MDTIADPTQLTPWELRDGLWYKREDYHRNIYGVNGAKYRSCRYLMKQAVAAGHDHVVSASSVLSPQAAISATLAEELGLDCTLVLGSTRAETAIKNPSVAIAVAAGARLDTSTRVAFNPALQRAGAQLADLLGAWQLPYGITTPPEATPDEVEAFLAVGGEQVRNLPDGLRTLVVPFGSGNSAAAILYGLAKHGHPSLQNVVLVGIGPDRWEWTRDRLMSVGVSPHSIGPIERLPLHGWFASYGDRMPETSDGIVMHPTYEGKVVRFLNEARPYWWTRRDDTTGLWIVGGPM